MTKKELIREIEDLDEDVFEAIIACCKELYCDGIQLYNWDKYACLEHLEEAIADWED